MNILLLFLCMSSTSLSSEVSTIGQETENPIQVHNALNRTEKKTRKSSFRVITNTSVGSGTSFELCDKTLIFTAQHVVEGSANTYISKGLEIIEVKQVYKDEKNDFAILQVPDDANIEGFKLSTLKKSGDDIVGEKVHYSGFPNGHDKLTIHGVIVGHERNHILVQTFGWFGASGSGLFDSSGRYVGIVSGIEAGFFNGMPVVIESLAWIVPFSLIDFEDIKTKICK
jgi:S1-C subfamily serine protease